MIARKINRLGFDSAAVLKAHYEQYGSVFKVLVSQSHEKQRGTKQRVRPSGIGYIVFDRAEDASLALAAGLSQVVAGQEIFAKAFERRDEWQSGSGNIA